MFTNEFSLGIEDSLAPNFIIHSKQSLTIANIFIPAQQRLLTLICLNEQLINNAAKCQLSSTKLVMNPFYLK